ncbi:MAG: hypothetical protein US49_C0002G0045 [candidate division TM6 bacterium GW2011_GWF2_37_49]|nr:MAG: hypothetical protein US49_C0002G0045 [candidate division TM6 bacterium GW2011_GWF2_37_49]
MIVKNLRKISVFIVFAFLVTIQSYCAITPLDSILRDMQRYKTSNTKFHAGHVFEHSIWVSRSCINLCYMLNSEWKTKFDDEAIKNIIFAAIFHDIGKCGDQVYEFYEKCEHPKIGFEYIVSQKEYIMSDGERFDFNALFNSLGLSKDNIALIAIIVGMHHELGNIMRGINALDFNCFNVAIELLDHFIKISGYKGGVICHKSKDYRRLIKYICFVAAADVISAQVVPFNEAHSVIDTITGLNLRNFANSKCESLSDGFNAYKFFAYETTGIRARMGWLSLCA